MTFEITLHIKPFVTSCLSCLCHHRTSFAFGTKSWHGEIAESRTLKNEGLAVSSLKEAEFYKKGRVYICKTVMRLTCILVRSIPKRRAVMFFFCISIVCIPD